MRFTLSVARKIRDLIQTAVDEKLQEAIMECEVLTNINCDWLEYELKNTLLEALTREIQLRDVIRLYQEGRCGQ